MQFLSNAVSFKNQNARNARNAGNRSIRLCNRIWPIEHHKCLGRCKYFKANACVIFLILDFKFQVVKLNCKQMSRLLSHLLRDGANFNKQKKWDIPLNKIYSFQIYFEKVNDISLYLYNPLQWFADNHLT